MAIELEDALSEAYKLNPVEYRWKKPDKKAPELTDDFKWNFLAELKKPQLEISGPSVGSLLYALNPQTSELGLKQMDSELNQQLAANENFDKRGDMAMKFMEQRVAEDIDNKQFADKMALEQQKIQNVDAGHANSLIDNYIKAVQLGDDSAKAIAQDRLIRAFGTQANDILAKAEKQAKLNRGKELNAGSLESLIPSKWTNKNERDAFINQVNIDFDDNKITQADKNKLIGKANQTEDWDTLAKNTYRIANINANAQNKANRGVNEKNATDKENWMKENRNKFRSQKAADEEYDRLFGGK